MIQIVRFGYTFLYTEENILNILCLEMREKLQFSSKAKGIKKNKQIYAKVITKPRFLFRLCLLLPFCNSRLDFGSILSACNFTLEHNDSKIKGHCS